MPRYEYKVVPAPTKGLKAKGVKGAEARFAHAVQELMNGLTGYGWEYLRAETLPSIERSGLTGSTTEWRNVLVFRRVRESDAEAFAPELLPAPSAAAPAAAASVGVAAAATAETPVAATAETAQEPAAPEQSETAAASEPAAADEPDATAQQQAPDHDMAQEDPADSDIGSFATTIHEAWDNGVEETDDVEDVGRSLETLADTRNAEKSDS